MSGVHVLFLKKNPEILPCQEIRMIDTAVLSRRTLMAGAAGLAMAATMRRARAAATTNNIGYFVETKPTMIAKSQGWFEDAAKAHINWVEVGSGAQINAGVVAGSLDLGIGIGSSPSAAGISQGIPYKVVAMLDNIGPAEEMTVRASDNIKTPADFKGKKIATPFGSTSHFRLIGFLKTNNLTLSEVTVLDLPPEQIVAAWKTTPPMSGARRRPSCWPMAASSTRPTTCWMRRAMSSRTSSSPATASRGPTRARSQAF
jgi:ABC-type taurine transport system substrate-binding protein